MSFTLPARKHLVLPIVILVGAISLAEDGTSTKSLPEPDTAGGKPLMAALKERQSIREFSDKALPDQMLANLLWAAAGVNRPDSGKRTVPSAMNCQEIELYVATKDGLYLYDSATHALKIIRKDDIRTKTGGQAFVRQAPVSLVYVADYSKITKAREADRAFYAAIDTGFIGQNVYLFAASEGLATVIHDGIDRDSLAKEMNLRSDQKVILAQCVGFPE